MKGEITHERESRTYAERLRRQGCTLQGVPGFYQDDAGRWTINFGSRTAGILLPAVGMDGLICGMQIRLDTPLHRRDDPPGKSGAKYIWLSSVGKPHGVTSGSPLHFVGEPFAKTVYVTEGLLKADIAHCLTGRSFVAVAGVNSLNGLESALRCMAQNGTKLVVEAYDMDKSENEYVAYAQTFNKAEKSGKGHIAKGVNIAKQLSEKAAAFGELFDFGKIKKIAKSANMLLSIDIHDFLPIEKEVYCIVAGEEQPVKKKLVLVFDDFERCKIGVIDLLGIINTYVEDKRIKTIVIASEDNIEDEENYKTFKEKVVERTVKLDMEYRRIQQEMIEDYKTETSEYKEFLKKESPKLFQVFEESGSRNLRTFKSCLIDFERVYGLWHSLKLPTDGMGEALYVFAAYLFEVKGGNYKKMDEYDEYHFNFLEEKAEDKKRNPPRWQTTQDGENSKYKRYNAQYRIQPLIRWMIEGEWNEQRIKAALNQRFSVKETAPEREVLDKAFWELSQEIIDRGLPQVLQQAYDGKLTTDDYVALLGRLDDFRKIGVPIQCDVDDARLLQGFHNRKAKIIKGDICEERGHRRLMRDEGETKLTPQEQSLNEEIEKLQDQWPYLMNEIFFIDYLKNPTYERGLAAKSKILVCFNDELLAAFLSAYKKANISEQQEMLTILKEISFRGGAVERDETDTEVTRKNLEKLENALNSEVEHTSDAVKKFYANRHLETVKQIRQKFLNTREM